MKPGHTLLSILAIGLFSLASCGAPGVGSGTDDLQVDLSDALATYQVLDLTTGSMTGRRTIDDLSTNDAYRDNLMVFRLVPGGSVPAGTAAGQFGEQADTARRQVSIAPFYCGVFEVTQGQWQRLASSGTPWTSVVSVPAGEFGSTVTSTKYPAFGLSKDLLATTLAAYNAGKIHTVALSTNVQWEHACRGGTTTPFYWGSDPDARSAALPYAVVHETAGTLKGPRQVGERLPNGYGLYDMHGNVWELVHEGLATTIRGGSWRDPLSLCRSAYGASVDRSTPHGLVGVRLVLIP